MSGNTYLGATEPQSTEQALESLRWPCSEQPRAKLYAALVKAQGELEGAKKRAQNSHLKNKYARLEDVIEAIRPVFAANGLGFFQVVSCEVDGDTMYGTARTTIFHASGEEIWGTTLVPVKNRDAHGVGGAQTYAKRYGLQSMAGIPSEDDDGEAAMGRATVNKNESDYDPTWAAAVSDALVAISSEDIEGIKAVYAKLKAYNGKVRGEELMSVLKPLGDRITQLKAKMILKGDK